MKRFRGRYARIIIPATVILGACIVGAVNAVHDRMVSPSKTPIDLRAGAVTAIEFRAVASAPYTVSVEMDAEAARRLVPCVARQGAAIVDPCAANEFPVNLMLEIYGGSTAGKPQLEYTKSLVGPIIGTGTYRREIAFVQLSSRGKYRLLATSKADGALLNGAGPKLIVGLDTLRIKEISIYSMIVNIVAFAVGLIGAVWAFVALLSRDALLPQDE